MSSASHLAPFVAALLRDKTVEELMQKVEQQDRQIKNMMKVEITGSGGSPVYVTGQFDEGEIQGYWRTWWQPKLKEQKTACPIRELRQVEVRLSGIVQFSLDPGHDQETRISLDPKSIDDYDDDQELAIQADDGSDLRIIIQGWQAEEWHRIQDEESERLYDESADTALNFLEEELPNGCVVNFESLRLEIPKYKAMIDKVAARA